MVSTELASGPQSPVTVSMEAPTPVRVAPVRVAPTWMSPLAVHPPVMIWAVQWTSRSVSVTAPVQLASLATTVAMPKGSPERRKAVSSRTDVMLPVAAFRDVMVIIHFPAHASGRCRSQTWNAILPTWPPGFMAVTVAVPRLTPAGTMNVALCPVAVTTWAGTPSTVIWTLLAPKPIPVIVTDAPTLAHDGAMLSMRPAWAAKVGSRSGPERANAQAAA